MRNLLYGSRRQSPKNITKEESEWQICYFSQVGTSYLLTKDRPYELPDDTIMTSPFGLQFRVTSCQYYTDELYFVCGSIVSEDNIVPDAEHDAKLIKEGFMYPDIGWIVDFMPGFLPKPEVAHINQIVPPPLRAWVASGASNAEMVLDRETEVC